MNKIQEILGSSKLGVPLETLLAQRVEDRATYKAQLAALGWPKNRDKRAIGSLEFYSENEREIIRLSVALNRNVPRDDAPPESPKTAEEVAKQSGLDLLAQQDAQRAALAKAAKDAEKALEEFDHGGPIG